MVHSPLFLKIVEEARRRIKEVTVHDAYMEAKKPGVYLVDVREESEWQAGHAPGAVHLGKGVIERDIEQRIPTPTPGSSATAAAATARPWRSIACKRWATPMPFRSTAASAAWREQNLPISTAPEVPPRSPHEKLGDLYHLPRMVDKARLFPAGKLPGYNYLTYGFDKTLLDFLCLEGAVFEQIVTKHPTDEGVLSALKERLGPRLAERPCRHRFQPQDQQPPPRFAGEAGRLRAAPRHLPAEQEEGGDLFRSHRSGRGPAGLNSSPSS